MLMHEAVEYIEHLAQLRPYVSSFTSKCITLSICDNILSPVSLSRHLALILTLSLTLSHVIWDAKLCSYILPIDRLHSAMTIIDSTLLTGDGTWTALCH